MSSPYRGPVDDERLQCRASGADHTQKLSGWKRSSGGRLAQPWREAMREAARDPVALARSLGYSGPVLSAIAAAAEVFPFRVTRHYLALADPDDPEDPILRQVLPHSSELDTPPAGFVDDAVGDLLPLYHPAPGLVHKYGGRALLVTTGACAVNCRFCFRRNYPYDELREDGGRYQSALEAISRDPSIVEVVLSGGDPLSLVDGVLEELVAAIAAIPHVRRLRVHTRMPVVLPQRITPELLAVLGGSRLQVWIVTHFNHPRELAESAVEACEAFARSGMPVLNQSVLLKGVNDDIEVLESLCEGLVDAGIKPYYLHRLDRVRGVAHFEVPENRGLELYEALRRRISGIALPVFVADEPGRPAKTPLGVGSGHKSLSVLGLLLGALIGLASGCQAGNKADAPMAAAKDSRLVGEAEPEAVVEQDGASASASAVPATPPPLSPIDRVLVADLDGDGTAEVLLGSGNEIRWGRWPEGTPAPLLYGRLVASGRLQAWHAADLDGDGRDEVVAAFGVGRGYTDAALEVLLIDQQGPVTVSLPLWKSRGARNQATALQSWPRPDGTWDVYVAAFESRFVVRGGVLSRTGGEPRWLDGHSLRMGMARAAGDFDGDGRLEVAIGRLYGDEAGQPGDLRIVQEDGSVEMVPTIRGVRAVGAADVDGNGRAELLFGDGWHKNYGRHARYRPSVARRADSGSWTVQLVEEQSEQYAVEQIDFRADQLVVGGNREVSVYEAQGGSWKKRGVAGSSSATGAFGILAQGDVVLGGSVARRWSGVGARDVQSDSRGQ